MRTNLDVVASSVDVDVLAADDSAELLESLSRVVVAAEGGFGFGTVAGLPLGLIGGLVLPPTEPTAGGALPLAVLVVFLVLTESLSVSSSSSPDEPSSSSEPEVLSGENILFCLLDSKGAAALVLFDVGALSFWVFVELADGVGLGAGGILDLMLPLPAFDALVLVSPSSCCCCCIK